MIGYAHGLFVAGLLFALGSLGLALRRNLLFALISVEVLLNATGLAFVSAGARWGEPDGQVLFLLVLTTAAAEAAVGLAILMQVRRHLHTLDPDLVAEMRG